MMLTTVVATLTCADVGCVRTRASSRIVVICECKILPQGQRQQDSGYATKTMFHVGDSAGSGLGEPSLGLT